MENKRGFSAISDLTSDVGSSQKALLQKPAFPLLDLTKWPTLPAPWSSVDAGETWIWEDFFLTFQKEPKTVLEVTMEMHGEKAPPRWITYHYAMTVFYRVDRNPHGPSHVPIMTVALEQSNMGMLGKLLGNQNLEFIQSGCKQETGPLMIGLFRGQSRLNLGKYEGDTSPIVVKGVFIEILGRYLDVSSQPRLIGDLRQAHGHPETGLPAIKKKSGCAPLVLLCIGISTLALWGINLL